MKRTSLGIVLIASATLVLTAARCGDDTEPVPGAGGQRDDAGQLGTEPQNDMGTGTMGTEPAPTAPDAGTTGTGTMDSGTMGTDPDAATGTESPDTGTEGATGTGTAP